MTEIMKDGLLSLCREVGSNGWNPRERSPTSLWESGQLHYYQHRLLSCSLLVTRATVGKVQEGTLLCPEGKQSYNMNTQILRPQHTELKKN